MIKYFLPVEFSFHFAYSYFRTVNCSEFLPTSIDSLINYVQLKP